MESQCRELRNSTKNLMLSKADFAFQTEGFMRKPLVVALEGIDGSGKSTLAQMLSQELGASVYKRTKKGKWLDHIVSTAFMQRFYCLQIPIYLLLSYKNYLSFLLKRERRQIIIMDRCFLSNICYFYPAALDNPKLLRFIMTFEVNLWPNEIFILDVDPRIGWNRDKNKKTLKWITETRNAYLAAEKSELLSKYNIKVIENLGAIEETYEIIINQIRRKIEW